jgi:hypothetical protein
MNINGNINPATESTIPHNWQKPPGQRNTTEPLAPLPETPAQPAAPGGLIGNTINTTA